MSHWQDHAQQWQYIGSPLRPCPEDIDYLQAQVNRRFGPNLYDPPPSSLKGLLLGVTPEVASIDWKRDFFLFGMDKSQAVVDGIWPGDTPNRSVICANWLELPLFPGTIDVVFGDGSLNNIAYPDEYQKLLEALLRVMKPHGYLMLRLYERPRLTESVNGIFYDLFSGRIGNFNAFKLRLMMALQGSKPKDGVVVEWILKSYEEYVPDSEALSARTGWPLPVLRTMENYRGSTVSYSFPSVDEVLEIFGSDFDLLEEQRGTYELGNRCPHLILRRR